ncbi:MAG TPA: DUF2339 domain-containing protein [Edaphobacter sp.]|nr:DUF2339 domain-containing protein [Edaphobacter sp.]
MQQKGEYLTAYLIVIDNQDLNRHLSRFLHKDYQSIEFLYHSFDDRGKVIAMAPDDDQEQRRQPDEGVRVAADLAALAARVESLERQLAELRPQPSARFRQAAPPPPRPASFAGAENLLAPNFARHLSKDKGSLENRIGSQLFSRIGIVALLVATTLFLKWAIDNHFIGPLGRILAGLLAGVAVVVWSERFRHKGFSAFSYSLKAVGSGALYLSLWAAFQLYHLLPAEAALGAMILVTAWNAYMAWSQNSQILAAYALAGAFATPLLLATGGNHEVFLFTYILAIDIAAVALVRLKSWPRLLLGAFPATVAFFIGWYAEYYGAFNVGQPVEITTFFIVLFFLVFVLPTIRRPQDGERTRTPITEIFLPLADATFAALALYSVLQDSHHHDLLPWIAVLFGAFYLGLMRLPQTRVASAVHLSLAVVFLTIAIPLKASGHWITVGWLAEGVALLWVSARLSGPSSEATAASHRILRRLAIAALALGFCGLLVQPFWLYYRIDTAFLNSRFATSLFGIAALAASAAIALHARRHEDAASPSWLQIAGASIIALNLVAVLACVRELETTWRHTAGDPEADLRKSLAVSAFLMLYGAGLLAVGFWKRSAFIRWQALILLVFTIGKTFLYDTRDLSQGYRVLSFLGLGALLMAISFAYQKDWLALRDPAPNAENDAPISTEGADK